MNFRLSYFRSLTIISTIIIIPQVVVSNANSDDSDQKFLSVYKIPRKTPQPINVDTSKTINLRHLKPLTLVAAYTDKIKVRNTGKMVDLIIDQEITSSKVYGGPLGNDVYSFHQLQFFWTKNGTGTAAASVNGHGPALQVMSIFYNIKYHSFHNATRYRDGVAQVYLFIHVIPTRIPNILFLPFADVLKRIQKAGSTVDFLLGTSLQWFNTPTIAPNARYFAFPGAYTDDVTGQVYFCATTMIYPPLLTIPVYISLEQFLETFGHLRGPGGKPLSNQPIQHPSEVPVITAKGLVLRLLPFTVP